MARPARVRIRALKPCLRLRRRVLGWKVRFIAVCSWSNAARGSAHEGSGDRPEEFPPGDEQPATHRSIRRMVQHTSGHAWWRPPMVGIRARRCQPAGRHTTVPGNPPLTIALAIALPNPRPVRQQGSPSPSGAGGVIGREPRLRNRCGWQLRHGPQDHRKAACRSLGATPILRHSAPRPTEAAPRRDPHPCGNPDRDCFGVHGAATPPLPRCVARSEPDRVSAVIHRRVAGGERPGQHLHTVPRILGGPAGKNSCPQSVDGSVDNGYAPRSRSPPAVPRALRVGQRDDRPSAPAARPRSGMPGRVRQRAWR